MRKKECRFVKRRLGAFIDGELSEEETRKVHLHLEKCPSCERESIQLEKINALGKESFFLEPGEDYWREVLPRLRNRLVVDKPLPLRDRIEEFWLEFLRPRRLVWGVGGAAAVAAAVLLTFKIYWYEEKIGFFTPKDITVVENKRTLSTESKSMAFIPDVQNESAQTLLKSTPGQNIPEEKEKAKLTPKESQSMLLSQNVEEEEITEIDHFSEKEISAAVSEKLPTDESIIQIETEQSSQREPLQKQLTILPQNTSSDRQTSGSTTFTLKMDVPGVSDAEVSASLRKERSFIEEELAAGEAAYQPEPIQEMPLGAIRTATGYTNGQNAFRSGFVQKTIRSDRYYQKDDRIGTEATESFNSQDTYIELLNKKILLIKSLKESKDPLLERLYLRALDKVYQSLLKSTTDQVIREEAYEFYHTYARQLKEILGADEYEKRIANSLGNE